MIKRKLILELLTLLSVGCETLNESQVSNLRLKQKYLNEYKNVIFKDFSFEIQCKEIVSYTELYFRSLFETVRVDSVHCIQGTKNLNSGYTIEFYYAVDDEKYKIEVAFGDMSATSYENIEILNTQSTGVLTIFKPEKIQYSVFDSNVEFLANAKKMYSKKWEALYTYIASSYDALMKKESKEKRILGLPEKVYQKNVLDEFNEGKRSLKLGELQLYFKFRILDQNTMKGNFVVTNIIGDLSKSEVLFLEFDENIKLLNSESLTFSFKDDTLQLIHEVKEKDKYAYITQMVDTLN